MFTSGTRLGPYLVDGLIGRGGMGEVYRAHDARLKRDVALKVLPPSFVADADRLARFEREAQTLASLNHPHIAQIYGVLDPREGGGPQSAALVMEFVDGEDLAARLTRGPLPVDETIAIAGQIAGALEAAHELGIVHRDLKPANIKVRADGTVKVLDFGLAKALTPDAGSPLSPQLSNSPTLTSPMTQQGVVLGTAAYMSPEQARGRQVDRRADIWAFGAVVWEMLTGQPLFGRETATDTLAAIVKEDPPFERLPPTTPEELRRLLRRCLDRDPRQRLRDIGEARISLSQPLTAPAAPAVRRARGRAPMAFALIAIASLGALAAWLFWRPPPAAPMPLRRFVLSPAIASSRSFAVAPDGQRVAYLAGGHLYVQPFTSLTAQDLGPLHVTADQLFWSSDSRTIGFTADQAIETIPATGGPVFVVCRIPASGRAMRVRWLPPATIVFSVWRDSLYAVPASGGTAAVYAAIDPATDVDFHGIAVISPTRLLVATHHRRGDNEALELVEDGRRRPIGPIGTFGSPFYEPGYILFQRPPPNAGIWALPFDGTTADMAAASLIEPGADTFSAATDGTVVAKLRAPVRASLVWIDRSGTPAEVPGGPVEVAGEPMLALSPDGDHAVMFTGTVAEGHLIVRDMRTGTDTPLTAPRFEDVSPTRVRAVRPQWFPTGDRILYGTGTIESEDLVVQRVDGTGAPRRIANGFVGRVSPDGRTLLFLVDERGHGRLRRADLKPDGSAGPPRRVFAEDPEPDIDDVAWSPDGRRFAYASTDAGKSNVYVSGFPDATERELVYQGATRPRFGKTPQRLFFTAGFVDEGQRPYGALIAAELAADGPARIVRSTVTLKDNDPGAPLLDSYNVGSDERLLFLRPVPVRSEDATRAIVIQNWRAALRR